MHKDGNRVDVEYEPEAGKGRGHDLMVVVDWRINMCKTRGPGYDTFCWHGFWGSFPPRGPWERTPEGRRGQLASYIIPRALGRRQLYYVASTSPELREEFLTISVWQLFFFSTRRITNVKGEKKLKSLWHFKRYNPNKKFNVNYNYYYIISK